MKRDRVVCVGNAGVDRTFALGAAPQLGTSNPAVLRSGFGGVARNVAENLARLDVSVALVTQVGDDAAGRALRDDCAACGIETGGIVLSTLHPTAEYVAILDERSELVIGASATAATDALTIAALDAAFDEDGRTAWTFADCTLPAAVLAALLEDRRAGGPPLAIDAVSTAKVKRLPQDLNGLDVLFCNVDEARALTGDDGSAAPEVLARRARERGASSVVLMRGKHGALVADGRGITAVAARPATPVDVTGAGDALVAGTLYGLLLGDSLAAAVRGGAFAAALTVEAPTTVSRALNRATLERLRTAAAVRT